MNLKHTLDWLGAVAGCFPELKLDAARAAVADLGALAPLGSWQAGAAGAGFDRVDLRFSGAPDYPAWAGAASKRMGFAAPPDFGRAPAVSPWLESRWDLKTGALESAAIYGSARAGEDGGAVMKANAGTFKASRRGGRFDARAFPDAAVARALADFSALAPVAMKIVEREKTGPGASVERRWSLRLARPLPFPAFQRSDISASFTARSAQFALLTPSHTVRELSFEGESLWAYFGG